MKISNCKLTFWLALATSVPRLYADKGNTDRLADQADAVVVGELVSGQQTGHDLAFVLSVTRSVKGDLATRTNVTVSGQTRLRLTRSLRGHNGLWFLKRTASQWKLLPVIPGSAALEVSGYFPASRTSSPASVTTSSPPATVSDWMAVELAAAIQSYTDPRDLFNLAYGLMGIRASPLVPGLLRDLRAHPNPEIKFIGFLRSLSPDDDIVALEEIANNLDLVLKLHTKGLLIPSITGRLNPDQRAIRALGRIAMSSDLGVQQCAASALKSIHTRDTLPLLAQLLDGSDAMVREEAMKGLSRFVDNLADSHGLQHDQPGSADTAGTAALPHCGNGQVLAQQAKSRPGRSDGVPSVLEILVGFK